MSVTDTPCLKSSCRGSFFAIATRSALLSCGILLCCLSDTTGWESKVSAETLPQETAVQTGGSQESAGLVSQEAVYRYLAREMDQGTDGTVVYDDQGSGAAGFYPINWSGDTGDLALETDNRERPFSGSTCACITYQPRSTTSLSGFIWGKAGWAGLTWAFPNVAGGNWGAQRGRVLVGATELTGWIRGESGGEMVRLEAGGINLGPGSNPGNSYKDTLERVKTAPELLTLTTEWQPFRIAIPPGANLTGVIGGLSVFFDAKHNPKGATVYLDEVKYNNSNLKALRLVRSYQLLSAEEDKSLRNAAFLYDNALTILAFLGEGSADGVNRVKILADTLVWLQNHDRFYRDGRWRNAYLAGPIDELAYHTARLPGWWQVPGIDTGGPNPSAAGWVEDRYQVSTDTGNMAWAVIALLAAHHHFAGQQGRESLYLRAALRGAEWVERNCRVDETGAPSALVGKGGGYAGGFDGWESGQGSTPPVSPQGEGPKRLLWRSTEHNIDLYVAFTQLAEVTGDPAWQERAGHARQFVLNMYDRQEGFFRAGAVDLEGAVNKEVTPLDVQTWSVLAMGRDPEFRTAIGWQDDTQLPAPVQWLEAKVRELQPAPSCGGPFGYRFSREGSGIWGEGTAQVAAVYHFLGRQEQADSIIGYLASPSFTAESFAGGDRLAGLYAACPGEAETGFHKEMGTWSGLWTYPRRPHIGATCWYLFAKLGINPFGR